MAHRLAAQESHEGRDAAGKAYRAAEQVTHQGMNQLYFGSGANADDLQPALGLPDYAAMKRFLTNYAVILDLLAYSGNPATIRQLIELYEYLTPAAVFDIVHNVLLGSAAREGYHESLANSVVVRAIRRYIVDHRSIFDDSDRRARLVAILALFSDVGWSDALKLIYGLLICFANSEVRCRALTDDQMTDLSVVKPIRGCFAGHRLKIMPDSHSDRDGMHETTSRLQSRSLDHIW